MPVLDAKALEVDPQGMTFLKRVLRPLPSSLATQPREVVRPKGQLKNVRIHFRLTRRSKQLLTHLA